jgi:hypothetical protein
MTRRFDFKWALQAYQENPYRLRSLDGDDIRHLRRWAGDDRCEEIWWRLGKPLSAPPKGELWYLITGALIDVVLSLRKAAEAQHARAADYRKRNQAETELGNAIMHRLKKIAKAATRGKSINAAIWEGRARLFQQAADLCLGQTKRAADPAQQATDRDGSLRRNWFSARLSEHLYLLTGRWFDAEVAVLVEIAFPGKDVTVDAVRKARRR